MFHVGDIVICVDDAPKKGPIGPLVPIHELIRKGRLYRVNYIGRSSWGKPQLGLEGVTLPHPMRGFAVYRFRKIRPADEEFAVKLSRPIETRSRNLELCG